MRKFEAFFKKMELQDHLKSDWRQYFCNQPPVELDTNANHHFPSSELESSSVTMEGNSHPYCSIWTNVEQARVKSCNSRSFAMDARIRLDSLKSGCNSPLPRCARDGMMFKYKHETDPWDSEELEGEESSEESEEEESALDLVELLEIEDAVQDEENWLYESPKKQGSVERTESALSWCRRVLDNPSPETEAARRSLIQRLDQRSSSPFCRRPTVSRHPANVPVGSSTDKTSVSTAHNTSDGLDNNKLNTSDGSITTSYRLQDITDVHIIARLQEASLRQDYVSTPAAASSRRGPEPPVTSPSYFHTTVENIDDFTPGNKTEASSSSCWQPALPSSSPCQSPPLVAKQGCQSPRLAVLHQQVTQFKLLKLQNQATSSGRTRSPLRTSLRSLQAVRNSRSLETDDYQPADSQISYPQSDASSVRNGSSCWSPSLSAASMNSNGSMHSARASLDRTTAVKRLQRSQSVSPCRIPHPAKGYLSVHGRVFASPERSTTVAWTRNVPSTQR